MASFMKGDFLSRTRRLVKGLAKPEPIWLKAMEQAPPATFPLPEGTFKKITQPEDFYVRQLYKKYGGSIIENTNKISACEPSPARTYGLRVVELKEQGVKENEAIALADMEFRAARKARKKAYKQLNEIAQLKGMPLPYP